MDLYVSFSGILSALIFVTVGLIVFVLAFKAVVRVVISAYHKELIEQQNMALSIVIGLLALAVAIIVAAAVH